MTHSPLHHLSADHVLVASLRDKTPAQRLATAHGMWSHARRLIVNVLKIDHPDWTEEQICREAARRLSHGAG